MDLKKLARVGDRIETTVRHPTQERRATRTDRRLTHGKHAMTPAQVAKAILGYRMVHQVSLDEARRAVLALLACRTGSN